MTRIAPKNLVHRGHIEATGYLFDPVVIGETEVRRRVLEVWCPGVRVFQTAAGVLLQMPSPKWVDCAAAPGLPLTSLAGAKGSVWTALPLTEAEAASLAPPPGSIVLFRYGAVCVETMDAGQQIDPARWLDPGELRPFHVHSLGRPPAPATLTVEDRNFDARKSMEGVPAASTELRDVLFALQRAKDQAERGRRGVPAYNVDRDSPFGRAGQALGGALGGLFRDFQVLFGGGGGATGTGAGRAGAGRAGQGRAPSGPGAVPQDWELPFADRLSRVARRAAARMIGAFRLSGLIGRKHAEYVGKMLDLFERGDLTEALKHAIPLGSMPGMDHLPPSLGGLGPRADLSINPFMAPPGSAIGVGGAFFEDLESIYRRAFQRLEQEGRIEEAAFVLAELLQANEEAVAFLERHGRFRLAAEIAEARGLPPGLVIRQWFLAGDRDRAVAMARKLGAFADAVSRLERSDPEKAKALRLLWADALASAGDYTGAVEAAWPVEEARHLTLEWLNRVLVLGGVAAARMLPRRLLLQPEAWAEVRATALELLDQEDVETAPERVALADALRKAPPSPQTTTLARAAARALLRDGGAGIVHLTGNFRQLVSYAGDGVLRADLPELPSPKLPHLASRGEPADWNLTSADVGTLPVLDAALLPGGRTIVALGEAGARLIARDGRTIAEFREPAHYLVVSDRGDRAIVLAQRGDAYRLARLDFLSRKCEYWCEAQLTTWAPDFDGSIWFAATRDGFLAVDATAERLASLWRVNEVPGSIVTINRTPTQCSLLSYVLENRDSWGNPITPKETWQRWTYQLPNLVLRRREAVEEGGTAVFWNAVSADGTIAGTPRQNPQFMLFGPETYLIVRSRPVTMQALPGAVPLPPRFAPGWVIGGVAYPGGCTLHLIDETSLQARASFTLGGATRVSYRFFDNVLTVADDRGRLLALDLEQGLRLRDLRLT